MTASLPRRLPLAAPAASAVILTAEGLAALHAAPDPAVACARGRALLLENASLWERFDPVGAAQLRYCARKLAAEPPAAPMPPSAPQRTTPERLLYPSDIARARSEAAAWMLKFYETWPEDRPAPSGRAIEALADDEKLPWPRWILFEAREQSRVDP
jgi:hypothetical protein